jgi:hypothetical protein
MSSEWGQPTASLISSVLTRWVRNLMTFILGFRDQNLGQDSAGTFTRNFGQAIIDTFRLTERDDGGISRWRIAPFGRFWQA